jgi:hypothetical protein
MNQETWDAKNRMDRVTNLPTNSAELMQWAMQHYLRNLNFPADKKALRAQAQALSAPQEIFELLDRIEDRQYHDPEDVTGLMGFMQQ